MANSVATASLLCNAPGTQHDVFLSFRGSDTRNNFKGHLYKALEQKGIHTFVDDELSRGNEISPSLITAIKESKISIIIFSRNYASSPWCLDELVEILNCRKSFRQLVWPVFFNVDPSEVRNHTGSFGIALAEYEASSRIASAEYEASSRIALAESEVSSIALSEYEVSSNALSEDEVLSKINKEKLPNWKVALTEASNLSGWHLSKGEDESQLVQKIVEATLSKLNRKPLHVAKYPVGIEVHLHELGRLIDIGKKDVRAIGIFGIGGIGKTTIAKAVFNQFADDFEGSSFLANVRETSKQHLGFVQLQEMLLFDILGDRALKVGNIHRGINIIRDRLCHKRALVVLDDVDQLDQLKTLAGGHEWFGSGSRIIITTRNRHLLATHGANEIYEVRGLNHREALELFSWNAFKRNEPAKDYLMLSNFAIQYASGLPLALEVLGSFLCCRTKHQWQSAIHNMEKKPDEKLYEILKISYDALQDDEKSIFLDIACFFVGEDEDYVIKVLGSGNFCPIIGIGVLTDMSLVKIESNKLRMHHLIQEMGKEIVRRESPEVGKRSRLWSANDVFHVLSENTGTIRIEGIMLKLLEQKTLCLNDKSFKKMKRLRLLVFDNVVLSTAINCLPNDLRFIEIPGYQFPTFSFNSGPKQLVILSMPHSHICEFGKGFKNFDVLKVVNLSCSKFLRKIPDLSTVPNLEKLLLSHCSNLVEIHESVGYLKGLVTLELESCSSLRSFPSNLVSKSFATLNFRGCSIFENFPNIAHKMKHLDCLDLSGTAIKELPSSIELLEGLKEFNLFSCAELMFIPTSIYKLLNLEHLVLGDCSKLSKFPKNITFSKFDELLHSPKLFPLVIQTCSSFEFPNLKSLDLENCNLSEVDFLMNPYSFSKLESLNLARNKFLRIPSLRKLFNLSDLNLSKCELLWEIPELPQSVLKLDASDCKSLVETHGQIMAKIISNDVVNVTTNKLQHFVRYSEIEVILPGDDIPDWFTNKQEGKSISILLYPDILRKLSGVIICAVLQVESVELMLSLEVLSTRTLERKFLLKPGNMQLFYLPASVIFQLFSPLDISECRFSFSDSKRSTKVVSRCGVYMLQDDQEETGIHRVLSNSLFWRKMQFEQEEPLVVSHSSDDHLDVADQPELNGPTPSKRCFADFAYQDPPTIWSLRPGKRRFKFVKTFFLVNIAGKLAFDNMK